MAKRNITPGKRRRKTPRFQEPAKCRYCRDKVREVDYKDLATLSKLLTPQGKMFSRKRSGNCASHQRSCKNAIKRARFIGLLPYIG